jgi:hypothetical protein
VNFGVEKTTFMKTNMLDLDRAIRMLVAFALIVLNFIHILPAGVGMVLLIVAVTFLVTSYTGFCPFYWLVGFKGHKSSH